MAVESKESEASTSSDAFLGSISNLEDPQSTPALESPFAFTCPSASSNPILSQDSNATLSIEGDTVSPRRQSPEPMEEDKEHMAPPETPKQDQTPVPDEEPQVTPISENSEKIGTEVIDVSESPAPFVRETRQSFHFGSYGRQEQAEGIQISRLASSEDLDSSVSISLAPTLPSPMSRPEKKTYCCAECGKEYASRSGLKVGEKKQI